MVIGIGIVFCICASFVWHSDNDQPIKRVPSQRADELPILPKTKDIQTYQDNVCKKCPYFDSYDMCLRREDTTNNLITIMSLKQKNILMKK